MSTVIRPRGPLPPQVYWVRRLVLLVAAVVAIALLWWALPSFGSPDAGATDPSAASGSSHDGSSQHAGSTHHDSGPGAGAGSADRSAGGPDESRHTSGPTKPPNSPGGQQPSGQHASGQQQQHSPPRHPTNPPHATQQQPSGPCNAADLRLSVDVDNAPVGHGTTVGLRLSTRNGQVCTLGITPNLLEVRIISVPATIWQSRSCPDALPARNVVVGPKPRVVYSFDWDGQFNPDSCSASNRIAQPGGYWAQAALVGGIPAKSYFEVTNATPAR